MGLFDAIFRPDKRESVSDAAVAFKTLTAYKPAFTTWGGAIYESDLVRAAIDARARHISKLKVETFGAAKPSLQRKLKLAPNAWQTWSQFLYRTSTILDVETTCCIVPVLDEYLQVSGYFPVLPRRCTIVEYEGEPWLRYEFINREIAAARMDEVAILTRFQFRSDFFGDKNGALDETMRLIHIHNEGIEEAVKSSARYSFIAEMANFSKTEDLVAERRRFSKANLSAEAKAEGGLLLFPNVYKNIKQVTTQPYTVDAEQMQLIRTNVSEYFGVNDKVMQNAASEDELAGFFAGAIEPFSIQFSEAMSAAMFTPRERAEGNYLIANANRLQYMSTTAKVQMAQQLLDRGVMTVNEARELFNYPAVDDGDVRFIRGEYAVTDDKLATDEEVDDADER